MLSLSNRFSRPDIFDLWRPLISSIDRLERQDVPDDAAATHAQSSVRADGRVDFAPPFELYETADHYVVTVETPGVDQHDLAIELAGNTLTVSGERRSNGRQTGRPYGKFQRSFTVPDGTTADGLAAEYRNGELTISLQKPAAAKPTRIRIGDGGKAGFLKTLLGERKAPQAASDSAASPDSSGATSVMVN